MKQDYCQGTPKEKEKWIVEHIRPEFRNGYREVVGLPIKEKEDGIYTPSGGGADTNSSKYDERSSK